MEAPVMIEVVTNPLSRVEKDSTSVPKKDNTNNTKNSTGFPFDDSDFDNTRDRGDRPFRSHLDDLAKRHPELAQHLNFDKDFNRFPFGSNTWGHKRRGSATAGDNNHKPSGSNEFPQNRRFARPFGSKFEERFGFPFSKTFDGEPEYYRQSSSKTQQPEQPKTQQHQTEQPQTQQQQNKPEKKEEKPSQVADERKQNSNIPQSSTVDLGQKQEPVDDTRGQRSMSAPPENRAGQQRFVSSINIPIQTEGGGDPNAQQQQQQQQQWQQQQPPPPPPNQQQQNRGGERVIPIHVEGRDKPVMPKPGGASTGGGGGGGGGGGQSFPQPQPQPERMFGQRPPGFGGWGRPESPYYSDFPADSQFFPGEQQYFDGAPQFFKNRGEPHPRMNAEEFFANPPGSFRHPQQQQQQFQKPQQQQKPPQQQHHQQQQQPQQQYHQPQGAPPPQQQPPQQQQQQPQQQAPSPQPPPQKLGPMDQIQGIKKGVMDLMTQVEKFNGKPKDKQYMYLDEMLTRNLLKLDDVETEGKENIRHARKEVINCIQRCISILEAKAKANELLRNEFMDVDVKIDVSPIPAPIPAPAPTENAPDTPIANLEVSGVSRSGTQVMANECAPENQQVPAENVQEGAVPMEIAPAVPVGLENLESGNAETPAAPTAPEGGEVKVDEALKADGEVKEGEQVKEESKEQSEITESKEQPAEGSENASQTTEATKGEVKDKKDKKKVKKKDKAADKAEKK